MTAVSILNSGIENKPTLLLNADYQPLSVFPLSTIGWQEAVRRVLDETANVVAVYDDLVVRSPTFQMQVPSVLSLKRYVETKAPSFTRYNVFLRDGFRCQYCGQRFHASELTFDHLHPRSKGGKTNWENIVSACMKCNLKKADKSLKESGLELRKMPFKPSRYDLEKSGKDFPPKYLHETWRDYLYWDTEIE